MNIRSGPEPDVKNAKLWVHARASSKGSFVSGLAQDFWPGASDLKFLGTISGPNDNVVKGDFSVSDEARRYRMEGKIVAKLALPGLGNGAVFTARLLSPSGKLFATILAVRKSSKLPGAFALPPGSFSRSLKITTAWSKHEVAPGTSVKLTVTVQSTAKEDLPAGAAKILFSVPTRAFTDVTGVNVRKCGKPVEKGAQTTVACIPFDLGADRRTKVIFLLHVPSDFPGKRLGIGMKLLDANAKDPFAVAAGGRTAIITLQRGGGTTTTTGSTTSTPTPSPSPTGGGVFPTEADCQPKAFTMESMPYGTGQTFNVELSRFDPPTPATSPSPTKASAPG